MRIRRRIEALGRWIVFGALIGVACGIASAVFLHLLEIATATREADRRLVWALPLAGLAIGWIYERWGESILAGNNLVIDAIHDDGPEIPVRMAPMVLVGTVLTHLFGGSAGREGTAVQMGASLSDAICRLLGLAGAARRRLLAAGVAGGFGSVFGTPFAGAVFGLEFVVLG
ncbi:MAG: chloride channel protein, partial [Alphaproteobacteria bacterium]